MNDENNTEITRSDIAVRGLYMLLFFIAGRLSLFLINFLAFFEWVYHLVTKEVNPRVPVLSKRLGAYLHQVTDYLSYNTEEKPWPFASWPE